MTTTSYSYDPSRRVINVADARLNRILLREPERCATVGEYAKASGMDASRVLDLLAPYLNDGTLALEFIGDEVFVHTAPRGRPFADGPVDVAPNLWERLRSQADPGLSYSLWKLLRRLEWAGWRVESDQHRILFGMSKLLSEIPHLGVVVANQIAPLVVFPAAEAIAVPMGVLSEYDRAGARVVGVVCDQGVLEDMVTAARRWILSQHGQSTMGVMVLEAPRFAPTLLSPGDAAVIPRSVGQLTREQLAWEDSTRP